MMKILKLHIYLYTLPSRGAIMVVQFTPTVGTSFGWVGLIMQTQRPSLRTNYIFSRKNTNY